VIDRSNVDFFDIFKIMMFPENIKLEPTKKTPWVIFEQGRVFIMGRSISENPGDFYKPLIEWIKGYSENEGERIKVELGFEYINTSSIKWILAFLKAMSEIKDFTRRVRVIWYYEHDDMDMFDLGFILKSFIECPFIAIELDLMNRKSYEKILLYPL
jgi:hypothetical protein